MEDMKKIYQDGFDAAQNWIHGPDNPYNNFDEIDLCEEWDRGYRDGIDHVLSVDAMIFDLELRKAQQKVRDVKNEI